MCKRKYRLSQIFVPQTVDPCISGVSFYEIITYLCSVYGDRDLEMGNCNFRTILKSYFSECYRWVHFSNKTCILGHKKNSGRYISPSTRPATTTLGRVVTLAEGFPLTKSQVPLITWSRDVVCQNKNASPLPKDHNIYQIWHSGDLGWQAPTSKVTCLFDSGVT